MILEGCPDELVFSTYLSATEHRNIVESRPREALIQLKHSSFALVPAILMDWENKLPLQVSRCSKIQPSSTCWTS